MPASPSRSKPVEIAVAKMPAIKRPLPDGLRAWLAGWHKAWAVRRTGEAKASSKAMPMLSAIYHPVVPIAEAAHSPSLDLPLQSGFSGHIEGVTPFPRF
jgi:hypothetical protein